MNSEKVSLTDLRKQLKSIETAQESGYLIPQPLKDLLLGEIRIREGVVEVWECSQCSHYLEFGIHPKEVSCRCGKIHRTWKAPD